MIKITYLILQTFSNYGTSTVIVPEPFTLVGDCEIERAKIAKMDDWRTVAICITVMQEKAP